MKERWVKGALYKDSPRPIIMELSNYDKALEELEFSKRLAYEQNETIININFPFPAFLIGDSKVIFISQIFDDCINVPTNVF